MVRNAVDLLLKVRVICHILGMSKKLSFVASVVSMNDVLHVSTWNIAVFVIELLIIRIVENIR